MRVVILCGGSGTRLWPESREQFPKQFIPLLGGKSLLDLTVERVLSLNFKKIPIFIANKQHGFLVTNTLKKYNLKADVFLEPEGKNTCAAIYLAAKHSLKSDNFIDDLDINILNNSCLKKTLNIQDVNNDERIRFIAGCHGLSVLEKKVDDNPNSIAFSIFPSEISDVMRVADNNLTLPPKSTWFDPKPLDG